MPEWNWKGRDRATGQVRGFFTRGPQETVAELREHIEEHYQGVELVEASLADTEPAILAPVPSKYYRFGVIEKLFQQQPRSLRSNRSFVEFQQKLFAPLRSATHGKETLKPIQRISINRNQPRR